ncbi:acetyl-CoA carboxylase subunit beta [Granulicatella sp. HMSC30F09]|uniref:acetyl-CoA carboxylase, carboxyltransferase subunit beta n=1 Tax=Granulicatella TaxID=117563 RepID=UPI0008A2721F|nr:MULTISPECIES: acetyl-CoA carboxylase, carboxyltransferase subunit beta [Granulicatella]OFT81761.1 acetyl-CoA carboxylase subunit beta [Granulicatella sp. HMSC30F09]
MGLFKRRSYITINRIKVDLSEQSELPTVPDGKWIKCPGCGKTVYKEDLGALKVCPNCDGHFRISAAERLAITVDRFEELFEDEKPKANVAFPGYEAKLEKAAKVAKENEAVTVGIATIGEESFICCVMNSFFMMGSMGQVVGEKITKAFQEGIKRQLPVVIFTASGGARMQEGIFSLMQMAKISGAVEEHHQAGLFYLTVLTDPTTGGVTASFAMQGDIILAEPKAIVGFAGKRVIEQTMNQQLPDDFQTAETVLEQGFIDAVIHRKEMKKTIHKLLVLHRKESNA